MYSPAKRFVVGDRAERGHPSTVPFEPPEVLQRRLGAQVPLRADPLAGVPGRAEAEQALARGIAKGGPAYAAVFIVDRIHLLSDCFGYTLGDRLLSAFHERLRNRLDPADKIFRWSGTAFVALIERPRPITQVRSELERVASCSAEITVKIGDGDLALATAASWAAFPLREAASKDALVRGIDHYVAANLGR